MIRRAATYALIAAVSFATSPSFACTGISLNAKDGAMIRGRTMEFGFPLSSNVIVIPATKPIEFVIPAGTAMNGTLPDGKKGISYTTRYAVAGANAIGQTVILDGLNDQGLSFGLFYFPGFAEYPDVTADNAAHAMAPRRLGARQFCYRR